MRHIDKGPPPQALTAWQRRHPTGRYKDIDHNERDAIRTACTQEQYYLCAYCCQRITGTAEDTTNEHLQPRDKAPDKTLDFDNIVASCKTAEQCDAAHGKQDLPLTPLMPECETELQFLLSGRVRGTTQRARETIDTLNLGKHERDNRKLVEKRQRLAYYLLWQDGIDPEYLAMESPDLLGLLIEEFKKPDDQGRLAECAPVVINILAQALADIGIR